MCSLKKNLFVISVQSFTHNKSVSNSITSHCQPWVRFYQNHLSSSDDNSCDIQNHLVSKNRPAVQMSWADVSARQRYWIVDETIVSLTEGKEWELISFSILDRARELWWKITLWLCMCTPERERESKRASVKTKKKSGWNGQHKRKSRNKVVREARWEMLEVLRWSQCLVRAWKCSVSHLRITGGASVGAAGKTYCCRSWTDARSLSTAVRWLWRRSALDRKRKAFSSSIPSVA